MATNKITSLFTEYRDLSLSLKSHPLLGDIRPLKDVAAIKNALKIIINTRRGEKPFNPRFGCDLTKYLFEPDDAITKRNIGEEISYSVGELEPRVNLTNISISSDPDRNAFNVTLEYEIKNTGINDSLDITLFRIR